MDLKDMLYQVNIRRPKLGKQQVRNVLQQIFRNKL